MQLKLKNLTKDYGTKRALDGLDLELDHGIYALLGPNGAGKTTMINLLVGILAPTEGQISWNGRPVRECQKEYLGRIGYLPQNPSFYKNFTALEFLRYMCLLKEIPKGKIRETTAGLLEAVNLSDVKDKKIGSFSGGMRQRLGIAQALINDPGLLILDEPTAGLDPKERMRFRNVLSRISRNRIVIFATHIVSDIEYLADWIILLKEGKLVAMERPVELLESIKDKTWEVSVSDSELDSYMSRFLISSTTYRGGGCLLHLLSEEKPCEKAVCAAPTLNDVYLNCFGEGDV